MNLLFIDFGSSFIKYSIYDELTGEYISENKIEFPKPIIDDGIHFHVSTKEISDSVFKIIGESEKHDFKKILISVQMHGYITKKASGEFSDYISWRDKSGDIKKKDFQSIDINKFGTSLKNNLPLTKIEKFQADEEFFTLGSIFGMDSLRKKYHTYNEMLVLRVFSMPKQAKKMNFPKE